MEIKKVIQNVYSNHSILLLNIQKGKRLTVLSSENGRFLCNLFEGVSFPNSFVSNYIVVKYK